MTNATKVKTLCVSKKESRVYEGNPLQHEIELQVPYDQASIYYQQSGGTGFVLKTINQEAADMFKIGASYDVVISPSEPVVENV